MAKSKRREILEIIHFLPKYFDKEDFQKLDEASINNKVNLDELYKKSKKILEITGKNNLHKLR